MFFIGLKSVKRDDPLKEVINPFAESRFGPQRKYDLSSSFYHLIMGVWEIKPNKIALEMLNVQSDERVLDVAFGTGWCLQRIIQNINSQVFGLDFSTGMYQTCIDNLKNDGLDKYAYLVQANAKNIPFQNDSFDVVFSTFLLDLLPQNEIQTVLAEMKRVLSSKGRLLAMTLTKDGMGLLRSMRNLYELIYDHWITIGNYRASSRPIYLEEEIIKAGFSVEKSRITHIPLFHFPVKIIVANP
jgi:demethylmenaquinone methyltransferase/2-methoxy-6-polyprenyl-1,4-benzoquinol methylase